MVAERDSVPTTAEPPMGQPAEVVANQPQPHNGQPESVLEEAQRIVMGDREQAYDHPADDFGRLATLWSVVLRHPVTAEQAALCMVLVKVNRESHRAKRDNRVDMAGYALVLDRIMERRESEPTVVTTDVPGHGDQQFVVGSNETVEHRRRLYASTCIACGKLWPCPSVDPSTPWGHGLPEDPDFESLWRAAHRAVWGLGSKQARQLEFKEAALDFADRMRQIE